MKIKEIDFETIKDIWLQELWINRKSEIKPVSSIKLGGGYDMNIYNYHPTFWSVVNEHKIIGVNSGFQTNDCSYRSRGIWVDQNFRRTGVATMLMEAVENQAKKENCSVLWSIPRKSALSFYENFGFTKMGEFFDEGMEFGPNCYATKRIKDDEHITTAA